MPVAPSSIDPSAIRDILCAEAELVYKSDQRSRVWRTKGPGAVGGLVVKRFEARPLRQRLAALLGVHPAQRERRRHRWLAGLGLPAAPVLAMGRQSAGLGCRYWLITPHVGVALNRWLADPAHAPGWRGRRALARELGRLTGRIVRLSLYHRDHKLANITVDDDGRLWLIDAGAFRRALPARRRRDVLCMLAALDKSAELVTWYPQPRPWAKLSRADRCRVLQGVLEVCPEMGPLRELARALARAGQGASNVGRRA